MSFDHRGNKDQNHRVSRLFPLDDKYVAMGAWMSHYDEYEDSGSAGIMWETGTVMQWMSIRSSGWIWKQLLCSAEFSA